MKLFYTVILFSLLTKTVSGQSKDTLKNHSRAVSLTSYKYTGTGNWGYYLGHNSNYRQQFAEKYSINGSAKVLGVISHHTGIYAHPDHKVAFNIFDVGTNRFPSTELGGKEISYQQLDLSGNAMTTLFDVPVSVKDSFFVSFNLFDYAHGGYEGDTIGLLCSPDGTRSSDLVADRGRNVVQFHSHSAIAWRDYATQNFAPVNMDMIHLALYPIIEIDHTTSIRNPEINGITLKAPFPNPCVDQVTIGFHLSAKTQVYMEILDMDGRVLKSIDKGLLGPGESNEIFDIQNFSTGSYLFLIRSGKGSLAGKFTVR